MLTSRGWELDLDDYNIDDPFKNIKTEQDLLDNFDFEILSLSKEEYVKYILSKSCNYDQYIKVKKSWNLLNKYILKDHVKSIDYLSEKCYKEYDHNLLKKRKRFEELKEKYLTESGRLKLKNEIVKKYNDVIQKLIDKGFEEKKC